MLREWTERRKSSLKSYFSDKNIAVQFFQKKYMVQLFLLKRSLFSYKNIGSKTCHKLIRMEFNVVGVS